MRMLSASLAALLLGPTGGLTAQGRVTVEIMPAGVLGVPKALAVYLPESYDTSSARFPVAYYLHGGGGNERVWTQYLALDSVADSLHRAGRGEVILVMPDGDAGYWTDWEQPDGYWTRCLRDTLRVRPDEPTATYCVRHGRYETYLVSEVVPFVDSAYRTLRDRRHRGIGGFSMGGYGALALAARHPDLFAAAVSHSGVVSPLYVGPHPYTGWSRFAGTVAEILDRWPASRWPLFEIEFGSDTTGWWARDPFRLFQRLLTSGRSIPDLYLDVGTEDPFADQNRALVDTLRKLNVSLAYREWPGGHDRTYWRAHAGEGLGWLLERLGRR